jgi:hypothetical protein
MKEDFDRDSLLEKLDEIDVNDLQPNDFRACLVRISSAQSRPKT